MKDRIKQIRREAGLTRKDFAEKIRLSENYIYFIETGAREPSDRTIHDICDAFDVCEDWIRTGTGTMHPPETPDEELAAFFAEVMREEPDGIRKRWATAFSKLTTEQWRNLADIAETLLDK